MQSLELCLAMMTIEAARVNQIGHVNPDFCATHINDTQRRVRDGAEVAVLM